MPSRVGAAGGIALTGDVLLHGAIWEICCAPMGRPGAEFAISHPPLRARPDKSSIPRVIRASFARARITRGLLGADIRVMSSGLPRDITVTSTSSRPDCCSGFLFRFRLAAWDFLVADGRFRATGCTAATAGRSTAFNSALSHSRRRGIGAIRNKTEVQRWNGNAIRQRQSGARQSDGRILIFGGGCV